MSSVDDRTRAALDAVTRQVDSAPPLPLPPPPGRTAARRRWHAAPPWRRWAPWLVPAAAAAAVVAIAVSLVIVKDVSAGRPASPAPAGIPGTVPRYYVALPGYDQAAASAVISGAVVNNPPVGAADAVVGDTFSGQRLAAVPAPAGWKFVSVAAAGDDRTFVVGAYKTTPPRIPTATHWYLIRLTPGAVPFATLRGLPIPAPSRFDPTSTALSPDGTMLALSDDNSVRLYSTATGTLLHTWSPSRAYTGIVPATLLSWTSDGRQLVFETLGPSPRLAIRLLPVSDPGHDLLADSRLAWSMPAPPIVGHPTVRRPFGCAGALDPSVLLTGDEKTVVCGASGVFRAPGGLGNSTCPTVPAWNEEGVLEYSTATGKVARTLYRGESNCMPASGPVQLLWTSDSGDAAIGYFEFTDYSLADQRPVIRFGLFTAGKFTPLPATPTITTDPALTAW
jgi:hypothetical protein